MENNEEQNSTPQEKQKFDAASIYPDAKSTRPEQEPEAAPNQQKPQTKKSKGGKGVFIPMGTVVAVLAALVIGLILGRTVFKAAPTPEEAAKVLFDGAFDELSSELNGFDFSDFDFSEFEE